jgi:hypothetical protein
LQQEEAKKEREEMFVERDPKKERKTEKERERKEDKTGNGAGKK